jgi:cation transport ATPase
MCYLLILLHAYTSAPPDLVEGLVMERVRSAVNLTLGKISTTAVLVSGESIKVDDLKIGDVIACRTGDMVLADGVVSKGQAVLDER